MLIFTQRIARAGNENLLTIQNFFNKSKLSTFVLELAFAVSVNAPLNVTASF